MTHLLYKGCESYMPLFLKKGLLEITKAVPLMFTDVPVYESINQKL